MIGTHHAAYAQFTLGVLRQRQHNVSGVYARELCEDGSRRVSKPGFRLPLLQRFPQSVGDEADEDVRLDAPLLVVPDRQDGEIGLVDAERGFRLGELNVCLPKRLIRPFSYVGAQDVDAFGEPRPVSPLGPV